MPKNSKNTFLKVIVCSVNPRRETRHTMRWPDHNQDGDYDELLTRLFVNETTEDAGIPMDTLIVFNGMLPQNYAKFNGEKTQNGTLYVVSRLNEGGSFGGYNYAFENYVYDYYLFCEDDLFVFGDEYLKKIYEAMVQTSADFMALIGVCNNNRYPIHAHGGIGLVSRNVLQRVHDKFGELPHPKGAWERAEAIRQGEIPFTNEMFRLGYKLDQYGTNGWDAENLIMPFYDLRKS